MKTKIKNKILLLCAVAILLVSASSCSLLNKKPLTFNGSISIPDDGIIAASVFEELRDQSKVATFCGESGGMRYEWTIFGSDIDSTDDINLGVELSKEDDVITLRYLSQKDFGFSPVISIFFGEKWSTDSAAVYKLEADNSESEAICSVAVTGGNESILSFSSVTQTGSFEIRPEKTVDLPIQNTEETTSAGNRETADTDSYLSGGSDDGGRLISDGNQTEQDKYKTDPVPVGKPLPVEPEDQKKDEQKSYTCIFSIECTTILNNLSDLEGEKLDVLPSNGIILASSEVTFYEGESVYDVLERVCRENKIHMEASFTPMYNSAYVEGIGNLYEFDCGSGSGWMYCVDGWYPNYGCSRYQLKQGEKVEWRYTCDLGHDIGGGYAIGE